MIRVTAYDPRDHHMIFRHTYSFVKNIRKVVKRLNKWYCIRIECDNLDDGMALAADPQINVTGVVICKVYKL